MKRTPPQVPEFFTPAEIADRLKVTRRTVYEYIRSGQLPATKVGPKNLRITNADLMAFLVLRKRLEVAGLEYQKLLPQPVAFVQVAEQATPPPLPWDRPPVPQAAPPVARKSEQQRPRKKGRR